MAIVLNSDGQPVEVPDSLSEIQGAQVGQGGQPRPPVQDTSDAGPITMPNTMRDMPPERPVEELRSQQKDQTSGGPKFLERLGGPRESELMGRGFWDRLGQYATSDFGRNIIGGLAVGLAGVRNPRDQGAMQAYLLQNHLSNMARLNADRTQAESIEQVIMGSQQMGDLIQQGDLHGAADLITQMAQQPTIRKNPQAVGYLLGLQSQLRERAVRAGQVRQVGTPQPGDPDYVEPTQTAQAPQRAPQAAPQPAGATPATPGLPPGVSLTMPTAGESARANDAMVGPNNVRAIGGPANTVAPPASFNEFFNREVTSGNMVPLPGTDGKVLAPPTGSPLSRTVAGVVIRSLRTGTPLDKDMLGSLNELLKTEQQGQPHFQKAGEIPGGTLFYDEKSGRSITVSHPTMMKGGPGESFSIYESGKPVQSLFAVPEKEVTMDEAHTAAAIRALGPDAVKGRVHLSQYTAPENARIQAEVEGQRATDLQQKMRSQLEENRSLYGDQPVTEAPGIGAAWRKGPIYDRQTGKIETPSWNDTLREPNRFTSVEPRRSDVILNAQRDIRLMDSLAQDVQMLPSNLIGSNMKGLEIWARRHTGAEGTAVATFLTHLQQAKLATARSELGGVQGVAGLARSPILDEQLFKPNATVATAKAHIGAIRELMTNIVEGALPGYKEGGVGAGRFTPQGSGGGGPRGGGNNDPLGIRR